MVDDAPGFHRLHPTRSGGRGDPVASGDPEKVNLRGDKDADWIECVQCGWKFNLKRTPLGDGWGGNISFAESSGGGNRTADNPTVNGGCPLCGSSNPTGRETYT